MDVRRILFVAVLILVSCSERLSVHGARMSPSQIISLLNISKLREFTCYTCNMTLLLMVVK